MSTNPSTSAPIIDAWIQHPTPHFLRHPMLESLRRWGRFADVPEQIPIEFTRASMEHAGVTQALVSAWWGPQGPLVSNDEVAAICSTHPDLLFGVASVNLMRPMEA